MRRISVTVALTGLAVAILTVVGCERDTERVGFDAGPVFEQEIHEAHPGGVFMLADEGIFIGSIDGVRFYDPATGEWTQITDGWGVDPRYCPEANMLAFRAYRDEDETGEAVLHLLDLTTGEIREAEGGDDRGQLWPRWSPDGTAIAYWATNGLKSEIRIMDVHEGSSRLLVSAEDNPRSPAWLPDGTGIVYARCPYDANDLRADLWVARLSGSERQPLITSDASDAYPDFAPDGSKLAFLRDHELWIAEPDGTNPRLLFAPEDEDASIQSFSWSPDCNALAVLVFAYYGMEDSKTSLWTVNLADEAAAEMYDFGDGHADAPHWVRIRAGVSPFSEATIRPGVVPCCPGH